VRLRKETRAWRFKEAVDNELERRGRKPKAVTEKPTTRARVTAVASRPFVETLTDQALGEIVLAARRAAAGTPTTLAECILPV
jgi:hypothetical protein